MKAATGGDEGEDYAGREAGEEVAEGVPVGAPRPVDLEGAALPHGTLLDGVGPGGDGEEGDREGGGDGVVVAGAGGGRETGGDDGAEKAAADIFGVCWLRFFLE